MNTGTQEAKPKKRVIKQQENLRNLRNTKWRRKKNFVKKSLEISYQCDVDMIMLIFDKKYDRFQQIYTSDEFTLDTYNRIYAEDKAYPYRLAKHKVANARSIVQINVDDHHESGINEADQNDGTDTEEEYNFQRDIEGNFKVQKIFEI